MQVSPLLFFRNLTLILAVLFVPFFAQAQTPTNDTFFCKYFSLILTPFGACQEDVVVTLAPTNSFDIYTVDTPVPPLPQVLGDYITTVTPLPGAIFASTTFATVVTASPANSFEQYTNQRFTGLLSHVHWLLSRGAGVSGPAIPDSQYEHQVNAIYDSQADSISALTNGGDLSNGTLTNFTITDTAFTRGTSTDLTLITPTLTSPTLAGNLRTNGFWFSSDGDDEGLFIDTDGNVGIGTSTPSDRLSITGGAIYLENFIPPGSTNNLIHAAGGSLYWSGSIIAGATIGTWDTNGTDVSRSTGSVGIGTSTPSSKLEVVGGDITMGNGYDLLWRNSSNATTSILELSGDTTFLRGGGGTPTMRIDNSTGTNLMTFLEAGNVGIGTSTPGSLLTVAGVGLFTGNITAPSLIADGTSANILYVNANPVFKADISDTSATVGIYNVASGDHNSAFGLNNTANTATYSSAFGFSNIASGYLSSAFGSQNTVSNNTSLAFGASNNVSGVQSAAFGYAITNSLDNTVMIGPSNTAKVTINSSGNVGIGTTDPQRQLVVQSSATSTFALKTTKGSGIGDPEYSFGEFDFLTTDVLGGLSSPVPVARIAARATTGSSVPGGELVFYTNEQGGSQTQEPVERLRITRSGNVGIGTTIPGTLLTVAGQITATAGAVSVPTFSFIGDTNTGISRPTTDTLNFVTAGSERVRIDSSGNLGIGTTTPGSLLTVAGNGLFSGSLTANSLSLTNALSVANGGTGATTLTGLLLGNGTSAFTATTTLSASYIEDAYLRNTGDSMSGNLTFSGTSANIALGSNYLSGDGDDEGIYVDASGNVGVGTTTPVNKLHITDDAGNAFRVSNITASSFASSQFQNDAGNGLNIINYGSAYAAGSLLSVGAGGTALDVANDLAIDGGTSIRLGIAGSEKVRIDSSGNVGIGTTGPGFKLDVVGTSRVRQDGSGLQQNLYLHNNTTAAANLGSALTFLGEGAAGMASVMSRWEGDSTTNAYLSFSTRGSGSNSERMRITNTGNLGIGTTTISARLAIQTTGTTDILNLFETGGTEVFTVLESGNVGIGTTSPSAKLEVTSTSSSFPGSYNNNLKLTAGNFPSLWLKRSTPDTGYMFALDNNGLNFLSESAGTASARVTVDYSGNVGIGTTGPSEKLSVVGDIFSTNGNGSIELSGNSNSPQILVNRLGANNYGQIIYQTAGVSKWYSGLADSDIAGDGSEYFIGQSTGGGSPSLWLETTGNVGIGTTSPEAKLHVAGNILIPNAAYIQSEKADGTNYNLIQLDSVNRLDINSPSSILVTADTGYVSNSVTSGAEHKISTVHSFFTAGSEVMRIVGENVGIGTTAPGAKLHILSSTAGVVTDHTNSALIIEKGSGGYIQFQGVSGDQGLIFGNSTDNDIGGIIYNQGNDYMALTTGASERLRITSAGNVGIGTTSPSNRLHIESSGTSATGLLVTGGSTYEASLASGEIRLGDLTDHGLISYAGASGDLVFSNTYNHANGDIKFRTKTSGTPVDAVTITGSGNVGIGTTSPNAKLQIVAGDSHLSLFDTSGGTDSHIIRMVNDALQFSVDDSNDSSINRNTVTILDSGNVGIGTTSPTRLLSVGDDGTYSAFFSGRVGIGTTSPARGLVLSSATTVNAAIQLAYTASGGRTWDLNPFRSGVSNAGFEIYDVTAGASRIAIDASGNVGIGTTAPLSKLGVLGSASVGATYGAIAAPTSGMIIEGNVGIGTTTPGAKVQIFKATSGATINASADFVLEDSSNPMFQIMGTDASYQSLIFSSPSDSLGGTIRYSYDNNEFAIGSFNSNVYTALYSGNGEKVRIDTSGNVGIGTTTPGARLTVGNGTGNEEVRIDKGASSVATLGFYVAGSGSAPAGYIQYDAFENLIDRANGYRAFLTGGGNERMRIDSTGNVGIGTTTPASKLDVFGDLRVGTRTSGSYRYLDFVAGSASASIQARRYDTAGAVDLTIQTSGGNTLLNPTSGNVGIGTTGPGAKLDIQGAGNTKFLNLTTTSAGTGYVYSDWSNTGGTLRMGVERSTAGALFSSTLNYASTLGTMTATALQFGTNAAIRMTVDSSGNVGIGTTTPEAKLVVTDGVYSVLFGGSGLGTGANVYANTSMYIGTKSANSLLLETADTTRLQVGPTGDFNFNSGQMFVQQSTGNVGIGTTTPGSMLHIAGTAPDITLESTASGGETWKFDVNTPGINITKNGTTVMLLNDTEGTDFYKSDGSTVTMRVGSDGNVGIGTTTPGAKLDVATDGGGDEVNVLRFSSLSNNGYSQLVINGSHKQALIVDLDPLGLSSYENFKIRFNGTDDKFVVDRFGNVGIGITSPTIKLQVETSVNSSDGIWVRNSNTGSSAQTVLSVASDAGVGTFKTYSAANSVFPSRSVLGTDSSLSNGLALLTATTSPIEFWTNNSRRMVIDGNTGNVGIGTTGPTEKLTVAGTIQVNGTTATTTNKNIRAILLKNTAGELLVHQTHYWNGSSYVTTNNYGFGYNALYSNTGATSNGFGYSALQNNTGVASDGFGYNALQNNTGAASDGFGYYALQNNAGANANGFGYFALRNNTGANANGFGMYSLYSNTGANTNGFGYYALRNNAGANNTAFGHLAGYDATYVLSGTYNTFLGSNSTYDTTNGTSTITNATAVGANITLKNSNTVILGNGANVGIGTTTPAYKLDLQAGASTIAGIIRSTNATTRLQFADNTTSADTNVGIGVLGNDFNIYTNNGRKLTVLNNGSVGIGTTSPLSLLDVAGTVQLHGSGSTVGLVVNSSGNVGIGTTTPGTKLSVAGTVGFSGLTASVGAGSLCLSASNEVVYNSGSDSCLSSTRNTKHDITALSLDAIDILNTLQPVSFIYNGTERVRYGFIAEDTASVDDILATHNANGDITGIDDRSILSVMVRGFQEFYSLVMSRFSAQDERIEALEARIRELEEREGIEEPQPEEEPAPEEEPNDEEPETEPAPAETDDTDGEIVDETQDDNVTEEPVVDEVVEEEIQEDPEITEPAQEEVVEEEVVEEPVDTPVTDTPEA